MPLDTDLVESYCSNISQLSPVRYVTYNVTDEELADWGHDTPELTITISYTEIDEEKNETDKSFTLNIGRDQEELSKKEEAEVKGEEYTGADIYTFHSCPPEYHCFCSHVAKAVCRMGCRKPADACAAAD